MALNLSSFFFFSRTKASGWSENGVKRECSQEKKQKRKEKFIEILPLLESSAYETTWGKNRRKGRDDVDTFVGPALFILLFSSIIILLDPPGTHTHTHVPLRKGLVK